MILLVDKELVVGDCDFDWALGELVFTVLNGIVKLLTLALFAISAPGCSCPNGDVYTETDPNISWLGW